MYRAVAYAAEVRSIDVADIDAVCGLVASIDISFEQSGPELHMCLDGEDIEAEIRSPEMSLAASGISRIACVREAMVRLQREQGRRMPGAVLEGRDIGTVVFPDAPCKIYLDADPRARALRRRAQLKETGRDVALDEIERDILERDRNDSTREHSPLRRAEDAVIIDTTSLTIDEQVNLIVDLANRISSGSSPDVIVSIDKSAGFCWGVVRTIDVAEGVLRSGNKLVSLGDIIHNPKEIERLHELGMRTIGIEDVENLEPGTRILIRAHGEPPSTYRLVREKGLELVDATCPIVTKLQERIRRFYDEGYQVVIFGKKEHAEVVGLRGVCNDECVVVRSLEEVVRLVDVTRRTVLFSQTTMDKPTFQTIKEYLQQHTIDLHVDGMEDVAAEFHAKDTICGQVSGRERKLRAFAELNDVMIFVAGRRSSNGKVLFEICREANPNTYFVEDLTDMDPGWFANARRIGVTGATSTPHWFMMEVRDFIQSLTNKNHSGHH
jgi:4-hydroxy-3-methylbut-2-enyl diphosphate reductase